MATPAAKPDDAGGAAGLARLLPLVFEGEARKLEAGLDALAAAGDDRAVRALMRVGLLQPARTTLWYQRLLNRWQAMGRPMLKPNAVDKRAALLSDHTIDNLTPLLAGFAAALGVHLEIGRAEYDSVELEALNPTADLYRGDPDFIVVVLSAHWLHRTLGHGGLVAADALDRTVETLRRVAAALQEHSGARVLITSFCHGPMPIAGGHLRSPGVVGWSSALDLLNAALDALQSERLMVLDQAQAIHAAGGQAAYSAANWARAKMPYEPAGVAALAREIAAGVASLCGKGHRALVTDFDHTLWGGVIGDVGTHGIVSSQDDPDGLGYYLLQSALKRLTSMGVLLAAASKNDPSIAAVFEQNPDVALARGDFSSLQISWEPKSRAIARIASELGFGPEYMVFVDDNVFELAEAFARHPDLDVVRAGPEPADTLAALTAPRFFHSVQITESDLARHARIAAKQASRELASTFDDYQDYLRAIDIRLTVGPLAEANRRRVVQMLQKSNQFNLTTRRHDGGDLERLQAAGATIGVFAYEDDFGPQGVIAAVILVPEDSAALAREALRVESWVMSCRVLNRTVEEAIAGWIVAQAVDRPVVGEHIATEKNGIVRDLYQRLGFRRLDGDQDRSHWIFDAAAGDTAPAAVAKLASVR
jgi:FkbH-like protein